MTDRQIIIGWLAGMFATAFLIGVLCRHDEKDRSWSVILAPLWPALAVIGILVGTFYWVTEAGGWIGRKLPPHRHPQQQP